jgi:D-alanyl-D-alanine carboxypeptidase
MPDTTTIATAINTLLQEAYPATEPGAAIIAVKDGAILFRKGYGLANLELGVAIEPGTVFRLGSITKQITAVAILMLMVQGKLALGDPITRFLPEYPTHDHIITIEHLLTHTSGIRSYTDMPEWLPVWRKDFTVHELIDFFKYQPMQFAPGKRWAYNNSGYHLLGAIIETVSGQTYEQFLQQQIFDPLGMQQTYVDNPIRIIPKRAAGYDKGPHGYSNAEYLSMTQPYAAGVIASTVDDLARWDAALANGTLLPPATLERAWKPYKLSDGTYTSYGYGWSLSTWQDHSTLEHGGGIHGFVTYALRIPHERVFVALLSNTTGGPSPELMALKVAGIVIGKPYVAPTPIILSTAEFAPLTGRYQLPDRTEWMITAEDNQFFAQQLVGQSCVSSLPRRLNSTYRICHSIGLCLFAIPPMQ